tara:strand:- start:58 stop:774 length:717 start_codon:yes stop_codon:yes gene_type:complete
MLGLGNSLTAKRYSSGAWTPTNLGNKLIHWYKFNTGITIDDVGGDANAVTGWADQKGSNNTRPTVTNDATDMPQLQSDGTILFQTVDDDLVFSSPLSLGTFAIYFKINWAGGGGTNVISSDDLMDGTGGDFLKLANTTQGRIKVGTRHDFTINEISIGVDFVIGFERASNGDLAIYKDNVAGTAFDGDSLNVATSTAIGLNGMGKPTNKSNWYEVVVCNDSLSTAERNQLYNYLVSVG